MTTRLLLSNSHSLSAPNASGLLPKGPSIEPPDGPMSAHQ